MEPIRKTISRKPEALKDRLIITVNRYAFTALLALPIIAGLETYYQNRYGDPHTTYIGGFWTWVYGALWLIAYIKRSRGPKRYIALLKARGQNLEESITFSDEGFEAVFDETLTGYYRWISLSSFKERKRYLIFTLASTEFMLPKKYFTADELEAIKALFRHKLQTANQMPLPPAVPPPDSTTH